MRFHTLQSLTLAVFLRASWPDALNAQTMTPQECSAAVNALAARTPQMRGWERVAECGTQGADALRAAVLAARADTDDSYLMDLLYAASLVRTVGMLSAARTVALDRGATAVARATSLFLLLSQHGLRSGPPVGWTLSRVASFPLGVACPFSSDVHDVPGYSETISQGWLAESAATFDRISTDATEPQAFRDIAKCARVLIREQVPEHVDPALILLEYVCGDKFRVVNNAAKSVVVTYRVDGTPERGDLPVAPAGLRDFFTMRTGNVLLGYQGQAIRERANGGIPCSP